MNSYQLFSSISYLIEFLFLIDNFYDVFLKKKNVQIMYGTYIELNFKYTNLLISAAVLCRKPSKVIESI